MFGNILRQDLEAIANCQLPWRDMYGSTVLITGATGLIGSLLVKALHWINQKYTLHITLIAVVRDRQAAASILDGCEVQFLVGDIRNFTSFAGQIDYIVHCAAVTKSKELVTFPVENIQTAVYGTDNILRLAKAKQVRSVVFLSSMEVYGTTDPVLPRVTEKELGYMDITNPRSCYGESKRLCECLCSCYAAEYNVPVKMARLAQTFGAGVSREDNRVFAQFARSVVEGQDIVLHTDGSSTGNYCYTADAVAGILLLLLKGQNGEIYNIANEASHMTVRQMACLVAEKVAHNAIRVVSDIPASSLTYGYAPKVHMKLCSKKIRELGWKPAYGMEDMYLRMIGSFKQDQ